MTATIYHNPRCSKSRNALTILKAAGEDPKVVEYLKTGWTRDTLVTLFTDAGISPRQAMRKTEAKEMGLLGDDVSTNDILQAMIENPVLVERPIVQTPKGAAICRPMSNLLPLLAQPLAGPVLDAKGNVLVDEEGNAL